MSLSETARKNLEHLFSDQHIQKLQQTDPEFAAFFSNFAFDEVPSLGHLESKTRIMVILASLIAMQTADEYRIMLGAALRTGITPVEIKEIVYQAVPYAGAAKVLDFLQITNEVLQEHGVSLPLEEQATTTPGTRFEKGLAVQKSIFGSAIDKMYETSPQSQMHIPLFLSDNCFGDYYTRNGLDVRTRELLTFSILLSMGGCEPQLKGHIQGNINIGNDKSTLLDVITQLLPYTGYPRTLNAIRCLNEVIPE